MSDKMLQSEHVDLLGELANMAMGSAATTLSTLLNQRVEITTPEIATVPWADADLASLLGSIAVQVPYTQGIVGNNYLILKREVAERVVDLMMGGSGNPAAPADPTILISGIAEAMNQMTGSGATAMANFLGVPVNIAPPNAFEIDEEKDIEPLRLEGDPMIWVRFRMVVSDIIDTPIYQIVPTAFVPQLATMAVGAMQRMSAGPSAPAPAAPSPAVAAPVSSRDAVVSPAPSQAAAAPMPSSFSSAGPAVRPVEFPPVSPRGQAPTDRNIDMLMDVNLQVTVELGRTRMRVKDILGLGLGAVVELDRLAGEPVDLYLNDRLFARGEVVVIEESFGVRITEILSPEARVHALSARAAATAIS